MKVTSGELTQKSKRTAFHWLPWSRSTNVNHTQGGTPPTVPQKIAGVCYGLLHLGRSVVGHPAFVASLTVTGLLLVGRQLRLLEPLELSAFDHLMQMRPALPPDPRLLIVKVTEVDIQSYRFPLKDSLIHELLTKLEQNQPAVIGLDIYRDIPQPPGHAEMSALLQKSDRIVPVCKISDAEDPGTSPPPNVPLDRVGFSDLAIDPSSFVRRALLFVQPPQTSRCTSEYSFGFQLARRYLEQKGIQPELTPQNQLKLGKVIFKPFESNDGGYQHADNGGYQILLNYRSGGTLARSVTLTDILQNRLDPSWVKDRVVLIGVTAPSLKDVFYTPYSTGQSRIEPTPGVMVHGHIVSQLLSAVLDGRPVFWFWPEWGEVLWIWGWAFTGGIIVRAVRRPELLMLTGTGVLAILIGTSVFLFLGSGWIPVVAPILGLIAAGTGVLAYNAYEADKELLDIKRKAEEQEHNIALIQALLKERLPISPTTDSETALAGETDMPTGAATAIATPADYDSPATDQVAHKDTSELLAGHYKVDRVLGAGGFGLTYLAEDMHRPGAPKCVVKHLRPARRDDKFLQVARRLFKTEAQILEKLGKHPQIPQLLAYFEQDKEFYLVQEFVEGHPVSDELPVDKKLPEVQVIQLLKEVLKILEFIHEYRVIHRDIKPSNIMRRESDNKIVLIDFGAVKQIQPHELSDQENFTVAIGTRGYAPAEQYAGHPAFCSDIYALGMIGIQALTGIPPYQLNHSESGDIIWRNLVTVQEDFAQVLDKMVRYHFAVRYQSAAEALEDLEKVAV